MALPDGSVLSVNQNTAVHYDALRHLTLKAGEIFVEVAPHLADRVSSLFTVATPHRAIRAVGTKFLVRANADGTGVAVTQGQVHVSDWDGLLSAGQQLAARESAVTPTPRLSYLLDWTRDLVASATPTLVPANAYNGGALVAVDSQGARRRSPCGRYHLDVHIEDGFARTTIDQTYFNHASGRLEGTFYFPLPADASLSRLAMYVDGQLMEGGMVEREYGRTVFEQIVTKMKDPALAGMGGWPHVQDARFPTGGAAGETHHPQLHAAAAEPLRPAVVSLHRPATASARCATGRSMPASSTERPATGTAIRTR